MMQGNMRAEQRLIVAFENFTYRKAIGLARSLEGLVWGFKLTDLLERRGVRAVEEFQRYGRVFADRKAYQTQYSIIHTLAPYFEVNADFITVPVDVGEAALQAAGKFEGHTKVLGVTILTSTKEAEVRAKYNYPPIQFFDDYAIRQEIIKMTKLAIECGLSGIVCAPRDLTILRGVDMPKGFLKVTPNIRIPGQEIVGDDQNIARSATPLQAIQLGATHIVVGRHIMRSKNPVEVVEAILKDLDPSV